MALAIFMGSSSMSTMSAASMAASEPMAPMAMPMSALDSTGASLMPSPTKASFSFSGFSSSRRSTWATLSPGSSSAQTSSTFNSFATCCATRLASPVSITVFFTPAAFSASMAAGEVGLIRSEITMCPAYSPAMAM